MSQLEDTMQGMVAREFLLEPELVREYDVGNAIAYLEKEISPEVARWVQATLDDNAAPAPSGLGKDVLQQAFQLTSATVPHHSLSEVIEAVRSPQDKYASCCRSALCHGVVGAYRFAFGALRVAASVDDGWARHHHIYGLLHGARGRVNDAQFELGLALSSEPSPAARARIQEALDRLH